MRVYKFTHKQDFSVYSKDLKDRYFHSQWMTIIDGKVIVIGSNKKGYSWDGCSPKFEFLDLILGTPDGRTIQKTNRPITYFASMVHDVIYQHKSEVPISRKEADLLFGRMLKDSGFFWYKVYYLAVRAFGGFYGKWKCK